MSKPKEDLDDEILCFCSGVKRGKIRALHRQGFDLQGIADMTCALTGCEWEIDYFLKELDKEQGK